MRYTFPLTGNQQIDDLGHQYEKIIRNASRGSLESKHTYAKAGARFVKWVQPEFKMQKLANLSDKHLIAYAEHLKANGDSDKYIKNQLTALRYIHEITPNTKFQLGDSAKINQEAGLGSTPNNKARDYDQSWARAELDKIVDLARDLHHPEYAKLMEITYSTGCRLDEICTLRRSQVEEALRTGQLHLTNTKGGRLRDIPLSDRARDLLEDAIKDVPRGGYVFDMRGVPIHKFKKSIEDFIYRHRDKFQDPNRVNDPNRAQLHFHGLRHTYAQNYYIELRDQGYSDRAARQKVSDAIGHGRGEITFVYVA